MERWQRIDEAPEADAAEQLRICCGASRWVDRMLTRRPFGSVDSACMAARQEWFALTPDDWKEAFAQHARIGETAGGISAREQAGAAGAAPPLLDALMNANRQYEARFGYIFIVYATGRTAEEMLAMLRDRLSNAPDVEIRIAAEEHAKICDLRLAAHT